VNSDLKFFSQEWCDVAREVANANDEMYRGFKDAATFSNYMGFGVIGRPDLAVHLEWKAGRILSWTPAQYEESEIWAIINGDLSTWSECAAGKAVGSKLLMAGKLKLAKGPITAAIENAKAFNSFLVSWGQVPTDWTV